MLEKAVRIQAELHASAGATEEERLQLGKLIHKEEYKAWQDSEMCLMLCEEKDQMVLMPKFTKAHNASEGEYFLLFQPLKMERNFVFWCFFFLEKSGTTINHRTGLISY